MNLMCPRESFRPNLKVRYFVSHTQTTRYAPAEAASPQKPRAKHYTFDFAGEAAQSRLKPKATQAKRKTRCTYSSRTTTNFKPGKVKSSPGLTPNLTRELDCARVQRQALRCRKFKAGKPRHKKSKRGNPRLN